MKTISRVALLLCLLLTIAPLALASTTTIEMPVPGAGETLYLGTAQYEQARSFEVAFVLAADGATIHDLTIFMEDVELVVRQGVNQTKLSISSGRQRYGMEYAIADGQDTDMDTMKLMGVRFVDGRIEATMDYVYTYTSFGGTTTTTKIPFGTSEIVFEAQD